MIGHIYGRNEELYPEGKGETIYAWEYYRPESRKLQSGTVLHKTEDGIESLICKILEAT